MRVQPGVSIPLRIESQADTDAYYHSYSRVDRHAYTVPHTCTYVHADGDTYALAVTLPHAYAHTTGQTIPHFDAHTHAVPNPHSNRESNTNHHPSTDTTYANADAHAYAHCHTYSIPVPFPILPYCGKYGLISAAPSHTDTNAPPNHSFTSEAYLHTVSNAYAHAYPQSFASKDGRKLHRGWWTAFMRPSFGRFAHLLGQ